MDKISVLLTDIASKLGTTVEHLWTVLVRQAPIDGVVALVQYAMIIVWCFYAVKITKRYIHAIDSGSPWWFAMVFGWILTIILILAVFFTIPDTVAAFFNPEYWALEHVLNKIAAAGK